jgi:hypothetical protein
MTAIYAKNYGIIELPTLIEMLEYCLDVSARKSYRLLLAKNFL